MFQPQNRFPTIVLAAGAVVLLVAIAIGERMGSHVLGQATEQTLQSVTAAEITPEPEQSAVPYGPDWKRSETLSAAADPHFPDPRVPPQPLPTLAPTPPPTPTPLVTATPNPNIPIWRQQPLPTASPPGQAPGEAPTAAPSQTDLRNAGAGTPSPP